MDGFAPHYHCLYAKIHATPQKGGPKDLDQMLFVLNVPPYITEENLKSAFEDAGQVKRVVLCAKPGEIEAKQIGLLSNQPNFQFRCAYIVFRTSRGLQNALNLTQVSSGVIKTGIMKWSEDYLQKTCSESELQQEIDSFMADFDTKSTAEELEAAEKAGAADADGWVTVTKKSHPVIEKRESIFNKIEQKQQAVKSKKELKDFYRFQIKESKMKHIVGLRKRFEEDKKKLEMFKKSRRFKPL